MSELAPAARFVGLTKVLCIVIVAIVLAAMVYAGVVAVSSYGQVSV